MKKIRNLLILLMVFCIVWNGNSCLNVYAEEYPQVLIPEIEYLSEEEAAAYLEEYIGLPSGTLMIDELSFVCSINASPTSIEVSFVTDSNIGTASEIGVKQIYLQSREPDSTMYGSVLIGGNYYTTNADKYIGGFRMTNPEVGRVYRVKAKYYIIVDGVEYNFTYTTQDLTFSGK